MNAGKGDTPRPIKKSKYDATYSKIFGDKEPTEYQKGKKLIIPLHKKCLPSKSMGA